MTLNELFCATAEELYERGDSPCLTALAGFVCGKHLSPYSYQDTPKSLADAWQKCAVEMMAKSAINFTYKRLSQTASH